MNKEELIQVFENTKALCSDVKAPFSQKYTFKDFDEKIYGNISVEPTDTVSAMCKYITEGKTLVLNMASSKRPGGGVANGSVAQEECLFRCSNLFEISKDMYPISKDEFIYSKDVTFIKDKDYNKIFPISCDVITIAAVNLNTGHIDNPEKIDALEYQTLMLQKMDTIFKIARENKIENIILGAWGCGVFKNDPNVVAELFKTSMAPYKECFKNIVFAVINDKNSVANNYRIFKKRIN